MRDTQVQLSGKLPQNFQETVDWEAKIYIKIIKIQKWKYEEKIQITQGNNLTTLQKLVIT